MDVCRATFHSPEPGEVHVWRVDLDGADADRERLEPLLSPDERTRALRFHFERDRRRYVVTRGALRSILGRCLRVAPETVRLRYSPQGRPSLAHDCAGLDFNVSHAAGLALIAVGRQRVGIDLELVRDVDDLPALIRSCCCSSETAAFARLREPERLGAFLATWTRKEAILKATGTGLGIEPASIEVVVDPSLEPRVVRMCGSADAARGWTLRHLAPRQGFVGALAAPAPFGSVSWRDWRLEEGRSERPLRTDRDRWDRLQVPEQPRRARRRGHWPCENLEPRPC